LRRARLVASPVALCTGSRPSTLAKLRSVRSVVSSRHQRWPL
jgi:hypothetical protein